MLKAELISLAHFKTQYFKKFQDLFIKEFGFFFAENRIEHFRAIIERYLHQSPYDSFDEFYTYLSNTIPGRIMLQNIIDDVTIGETYFFRNLPQLDLFKEHIVPELVKNKRTNNVNSIKIWSAGCSTGEEVYSLAMILLENLPAASLWDIQLLGTDINRRVIKTANNGIYKGQRPKRHIPENFIKKYFDVDGDVFSVKNSLRKICKFVNHNLIKEALNQPQMIDPDIIFCRNVTIYFNTETTKKIINSFYDTLHDQGFLFLGHSETLWNITDKFKIIDFPKGFVYQKDKVKRPESKASVVTPASIPEFNLENLLKSGDNKLEDTSIFSPKMTSVVDNFKYKPSSSDINLENIMKIDIKYHEGVTYYESKDYDKALNCFTEILDLDENYLMAHFALATIYSNQGKYINAIKALDFLIETDNLFLEAYFLKAILHIKLNEIGSAIETFKKVIYIDPSHVLAYFHLGNLYREISDLRQSKLSWSNIIKICKNQDNTTLVPLSDNITYGTLLTIAEKMTGEAVNV